MKILEKILKDKVNRIQLIKQFQDSVWDDKNPNEVLSDLAHDLDYFEPNEELRKTDSSYYGEEVPNPARPYGDEWREMGKHSSIILFQFFWGEYAQ